MQKEIFLTGSGQTRFGELWDMSLRSLIDEAVTKAISDAEISPLDIDLVIVANMLGGNLNQQSQLGALVASFFPHHPPALRTEAACASGAIALHTACAFLESARAKTVLVVGAEKMTDASNSDVQRALMSAGDSERDLPNLLTFAGLFGLAARRYMHDYGLTREDLSLVSARHHTNAVDNPYAQFRMKVTPQQVTGSQVVSDPLTLLDCSPVSDGAAACILSTERESDVRILSSQTSTDSLSLTDRDSLTSFRSTRNAAESAFEESGISRDEISCIELHDCFSIAALIALEDLGFADPGEGIRYYEVVDAKVSINPSGGLKACGHPVGATGVKQMIDTAKYLRSGEHRYGMTHNMGGIGATSAIHILEYNLHE